MSTSPRNRVGDAWENETVAESDIPTTMYCLWGAEKELIYVGITSVGMQRLLQHSQNKEWWSEVTQATFRHFGIRAEAMLAERKTIKAHTPKYNNIHARVTVQDRKLLEAAARLDAKLEGVPEIVRTLAMQAQSGRRNQRSGPYKRPNVG